MIDRLRRERPGLIGLLLAFAAVYTIWGSTYLAIRFAVETIPPLLMMGIRFTTAGLLMYAFLRWRGAERPTRRELGAAALVGGLLLLGGTGAVAWALQYLPSGLGALIVAMVPMWMVLLDWLRPAGQRPGIPVLVGLAVGLVGVGLLVGPVDLSPGGRREFFASAVLVVGTLSWAAGSVYSRRVPLPKSPFMAAALEMTLGGLILLAGGTLRGEWAGFDPGGFSPRSILSLGYLVLFGSLVAFAAYVYLLKESTPARVGSYAYVNPVVAVFLGWALGGESLDSRTLIAAAIIIIGVVLIITHRAPRKVAAHPGSVGCEPDGDTPGSPAADGGPGLARAPVGPARDGLALELFEVDENIRYVAVNQRGRIVEMSQNPRWPSNNPAETDRLEELIVNPAVLDLTRRRGELDMQGVRYVVVRYGTQYQVLFPYQEGHLSVGVEPRTDVTEVARKVSERLGLHG